MKSEAQREPDKKQRGLNENVILTLRWPGMPDRQLVVSPANLAALAVGTIQMEGRTYKPKVTCYLSPTISNCYMDVPPVVELEEV